MVRYGGPDIGCGNALIIMAEPFPAAAISFHAIDGWAADALFSAAAQVVG